MQNGSIDRSLEGTEKADEHEQTALRRERRAAVLVSACQFASCYYVLGREGHRPGWLGTKTK